MSRSVGGPYARKALTWEYTWRPSALRRQGTSDGAPRFRRRHRPRDTDRDACAGEDMSAPLGPAAPAAKERRTLILIERNQVLRRSATPSYVYVCSLSSPRYAGVRRRTLIGLTCTSGQPRTSTDAGW